MATCNDKLNVLALIPARGGSKNPPKKNIKPFQGRPLIVHTIEQGLQSETIGRVIVSTDSDEIAQIARDAGAEVPFLRPAEIAGDHSTDIECFQHALKWLADNEQYRADVVVHLRPTAPLRPVAMIDEAVRKLIANPSADSVRSVIEAPQTPYKMWRIDGEQLTPLLKHPEFTEPYNMPRQGLPTVYWQNAYIDVTRYSTVMDKNSMTGETILPLVMDADHDVDIDSQADLDRAEAKAR